MGVDSDDIEGICVRTICAAERHEVLRAMRQDFLEFLSANGILSGGTVDRVQSLLRAAPEPIGAIAFAYSMITASDIDMILDEQAASYRPFGEIAVEKGFLTPEQVETLLRIQRVRSATETAEGLALAGVCPIEELVAQLGRFLSGATESLLHAAD